MTRRCTICTHPECKEIDRALVVPPRTPYRQLARTYGVTIGSLSRHKNNCIPRMMVAAIRSSPEVAAKAASFGLTVPPDSGTLQAVRIVAEPAINLTHIGGEEGKNNTSPGARASPPENNVTLTKPGGGTGANSLSITSSAPKAPPPTERPITRPRPPGVYQ